METIKLSAKDIVLSLDGCIGSEKELERRTAFVTEQLLVYAQDAHKATLKTCLESTVNYQSEYKDAVNEIKELQEEVKSLRMELSDVYLNRQ